MLNLLTSSTNFDFLQKAGNLAFPLLIYANICNLRRKEEEEENMAKSDSYERRRRLRKTIEERGRSKDFYSPTSDKKTRAMNA